MSTQNESQRAMAAAKAAVHRKSGEHLTAIAERFNIGERIMRDASAIRRTGVAELIAAIEAGTITIGAAKHIAKQPQGEQRATLAAEDPTRAAHDQRRIAKGGKAAKNLEQLRAAERRGVICTYAKLLHDAMQAAQDFTPAEADALREIEQLFKTKSAKETT